MLLLRCETVLNCTCALRSLLLTNDAEVHEVREVRRGGHLALVDAGVAVLRVLELQDPVVAVVGGAEPLVVGVRVQTHGQKVGVPMTNPRHLRQNQKRLSIYTV